MNVLNLYHNCHKFVLIVVNRLNFFNVFIYVTAGQTYFIILLLDRILTIFLLICLNVIIKLPNCRI